eukprot:768414-Hanusia_phi.AAC.2
MEAEEEEEEEEEEEMIKQNDKAGRRGSHERSQALASRSLADALELVEEGSGEDARVGGERLPVQLLLEKTMQGDRSSTPTASEQTEKKREGGRGGRERREGEERRRITQRKEIVECVDQGARIKKGTRREIEEGRKGGREGRARKVGEQGTGRKNGEEERRKGGEEERRRGEAKERRREE